MIRTNVLAMGALLLAMPLLASCGFDEATQRQYTPAAGVDSHDGTVDVLSAVIVAQRPGAGTFIAGLSNGSADSPETFSTLTSTSSLTFKTGSFDPVTIPAQGYVNLADGKGVTLTGDFTSGQTVEVVVGFDNGESSTLDVPVVTDCGIYSGLDVSGATPTTTAVPVSSPTAAPSTSASASSTAKPSGSPSATGSASTSATTSASTSASTSATNPASPTEGASTETLPVSPTAAPTFACGEAGSTDSPSIDVTDSPVAPAE